MADLTYHVVDVFTDVAFAGNPLAVVLGADALSTTQLAALAREFNLSETAFPMSSGADGADYLLRGLAEDHVRNDASRLASPLPIQQLGERFGVLRPAPPAATP